MSITWYNTMIIIKKRINSEKRTKSTIPWKQNDRIKYKASMKQKLTNNPLKFNCQKNNRSTPIKN